METFRFWCQKVLPLVYDNSLSYYEVLCKVVDYINNLIAQDKIVVSDINILKREVNEINDIINNESSSKLEEIIRDYIATSVFFNISKDGYFVAYIPESWDDITFATTGLEVDIPNEDFGHLVLMY